MRTPPPQARYADYVDMAVQHRNSLREPGISDRQIMFRKGSMRFWSRLAIAVARQCDLKGKPRWNPTAS